MDNPRIEFTTITDPADLYQIREITDVVWPITYRPILSEEQIAYMMAKMYAPKTLEREMRGGIRFDLLKVDGRNVGYMVFGEYEPGIMKLHKLYMLPDYHGQGLGTMMLRHVADEARNAGYRFLRLTVNKRNEHAIKVYEHSGFRCIEAVNTDFGGGYFMDDYIMELDLESVPEE